MANYFSDKHICACVVCVCVSFFLVFFLVFLLGGVSLFPAASQGKERTKI